MQPPFHPEGGLHFGKRGEREKEKALSVDDLHFSYGGQASIRNGFAPPSVIIEHSFDSVSLSDPSRMKCVFDQPTDFRFPHTRRLFIKNHELL